MTKEIWPIVVQSGDFGVVSTEGKLNPIIDVPATIYPLALKEGSSTSNSREYLYIRFSDGKLIASSSEPSINTGKVVAIAETDDQSIVSIISTEPSFDIQPEVKVLALCDTVYNRQVAHQGWVREEISKYIGRNTLLPQLLDYQGEYSNQVATTEWVRQEIIKFLGYTFTVIIDTPTSLFWNEGQVVINNQPHIVPAGTYNFNSTHNGNYYIYVLLDTNNNPIVSVTSDSEPSSLGIKIGTLVLNTGEIYSYHTHPKEQLAPPVIPLGDCSSANITTEWMINTWLKMSFGVQAPSISISQYKTLLLWTNGTIRYNSYNQLINNGSLSITSMEDGMYKVVSRLNSTALLVVETKLLTDIEIATVIIENNQLISIYPFK